MTSKQRYSEFVKHVNQARNSVWSALETILEIPKDDAEYDRLEHGNVEDTLESLFEELEDILEYIK